MHRHHAPGENDLSLRRNETEPPWGKPLKRENLLPGGVAAVGLALDDLFGQMHQQTLAALVP
jgi:hypothetical protein